MPPLSVNPPLLRAALLILGRLLKAALFRPRPSPLRR